MSLHTDGERSNLNKRLSVVPSPSTGGDLNLRIDHAVNSSPHLCGHDVVCCHRQGTVTLRGKVRSYYQKQMAQEALRKLDGVERIVNLLEVDWSDPQRTSEEIDL